MIFKGWLPTMTVVGTGVPPMGAGLYIQVPSLLTVSIVSTLARFGISIQQILTI